MLPEKPWQNHAILRLVLSLAVWMFLTGIAMSVAQFATTDPQASPWLFSGAVLLAVIFFGVALFLSRRTRRATNVEGFLRAFMAAVFCLFLGLLASGSAQMMVGTAAPSTLRTVIGAAGLQIGFLLLLPGFLREHQITWKEAFGLGLNRNASLLCGVLGVLVFYPVGLSLQIVSAHVINQFGGTAESQAVVQVLVNADSWVKWLALGVVTVGLAPVVEEILFRGILYPWVKRLGYPRLALWGVSIFFAAIHANLPSFLALLTLAILLTKLYENTRNLLAPITLHILFNATNFVLLLLKERSFAPPQ